MTVLTNFSPNPSAEKDLGFTTTAMSGQGLTRVNTQAWVGGWSFQHRHNAGASTTTKRIAQTGFSFAAGKPVVAKVRFKLGFIAGTWSGIARAMFRDDAAAVTYLSNVNCAVSAADANGWRTITITHVVPQGRTLSRVYFDLIGTGLAEGDLAWFDGWQINEGTDTELPYFDGDTTDGARYGYSWTGTPHASSSVATSVDEPVYTPQRKPVTTAPRRQQRGWRYFATKLNGNGTETAIDMDLPIEDVTIEDVLSGDQSLSGKIDPAYKRLLGPDGRPVLQEWGSAIYAENDGDIRFGGILTNSDFEGSEWSLETTSFTGYLRDLPYTGNGYKGIKVDPLDVVRVIWNHAQSQPGGNIDMEIADTTTGGKVIIGSTLAANEYDPEGSGMNGLTLESQAYKLNWYSSHNLAGNIDDLANATPFDYHERHYWDGDQIRHVLDLGYPKIGRKRDDLRFVFGVNIFESPSVTNDGSLYASGTLVLGAGEGPAMIKSLREPTTRPSGRLRRIAVVVDDTIKKADRADRRADQENQWRARIDDMDSIIVVDHPNARLGEVKVGDTIRVEGRGEWQNYDMEVRVLGIAYQPANGNVAEYTIARTDKLLT